ncbi:MAG TPA: glycoside hydrolase family 9 protein [Polyangiaceae bacterium]|nr:glycoside hydrolase family 9 protein [Polyangiaceae bacterium]
MLNKSRYGVRRPDRSQFRSRWSAPLGLALLSLACSSGANGSGRPHSTRPGQGAAGSASEGPGGWTSLGQGGTNPLLPVSTAGVGALSNGGVSGTAGTTSEVPSFYCIPEPFPKDYSCQGSEGPWAEALQKALWFFNVQKSGPGVYCTDVQWRGDAHVGDGHIKLDPSDPNGVNLPQAFITQHRTELDPDGNGEVDLAGGYHDAGDYIKFTMTTTYAASMIAWSMHEYPDAYRKTSLAGEALGQIRWAADYLMKATFRDSAGKLVAYAHQVADASDHSCFWMPPEVRRPELCPRKAYFVWDGQPAADVTASAAAALALTAIVTRENSTSPADLAYAERCLDYAKSLYEFAARYPMTRESDDGGLYVSNSSTDDVAWAAIWLYLSDPEHNRAYLDATISGKQPWLSFGSQSNLLIPDPELGYRPAWAESSPHSWDAVRAGVIMKLAQITTELGDKTATDWQNIARQMAQGFATGGSTPDGFYMYMSWGSARYNSAAQFTSLLYSKYFPNDPKSAEFSSWAQRQVDHLLGANNLGLSYIMGYTDSYPLQPHHAAGHASIYGLPAKPAENRHIIWGALVNGPNGKGEHVDARDDYGSNEVTIDYNGALVAALAGHLATRGANECPLKVFPPLEPRIDEFYAMGNLNIAPGGCRTQVNVRTMNESIHPPRYDETLSTRFWFDASEVRAAGLDPSQAVTLNVFRDTGQNATPPEPTGVKGPIQCKEHTDTYYFEFDYTGAKFWGLIPAIGAPRDLLLDYGLAYGEKKCEWDPSNDWSMQDLKVGQTEEVAKTPYITVYSKGRLIWGKEPPCDGIPDVPVVPPPPPPLEYPPR